jgi:hypothetical protein
MNIPPPPEKKEKEKEKEKTMAKICMPYILLILNCEKYKHKADQQNKTWLKPLQTQDNIVYFHIIGSKEKCETTAVEYIFDDENRILYTSTKDDYLSLPDKIITAINAVNERYDYKYIFKTDDDQDLIDPLFFNKLITLLNSDTDTDTSNGNGNGKVKYHYGGYQISVPDHYSSYHVVHNELPKQLFLKATKYCNGRFYLLSKEAVENILKKKSEISTHIIEDHAIGLYLDDIYKKKSLYLNTTTYFKDC